MLHNIALSLILKKWAQKVASLYRVALRWHKQERQNREDNDRKARWNESERGESKVPMQG